MNGGKMPMNDGKMPMNGGKMPIKKFLPNTT